MLPKCVIPFPLPLLWGKLCNALDYWTGLTWFTKATEGNKAYLECHVSWVKQLTKGAENTRPCHRHSRCEEKGTRASPHQQWPICRTHLTQICPQEFNSQHRAWQSPFLRKIRGQRGCKTLILSFPIYLQKQKAALCSYALARQIAVQLGSCLFHTTALSQSFKTAGAIPARWFVLATPAVEERETLPCVIVVWDRHLIGANCFYCRACNEITAYENWGSDLISARIPAEAMLMRSRSMCACMASCISHYIFNYLQQRLGKGQRSWEC